MASPRRARGAAGRGPIPAGKWDGTDGALRLRRLLGGGWSEGERQPPGLL